MSSVREIDLQLAEIERSPRTEEEEEYVQACMDVATPEQRERLTELDYLTVVRGYASYNPRMEETVKAFKMILDWREQVGFYDFLNKRMDQDETFHGAWPEHIYGNDKYGHPLVCIHFNQVNVDTLGEMDVDHMLRLQGQKQAFYSEYKRQVSEQIGEQRCKYSLTVDLKDSGFGILFGKKKSIIQKVFKVGSDYFPESIWKIYVINAPFIFRTAWSVIKPWIHPITQAKVNMLGSSSACLKRMKEDGYGEEAIPEFLGGTAKGVNTFEKLLEHLEKQKGGAGDAAAAAAEDEAAKSMGRLAVV